MCLVYDGFSTPLNQTSNLQTTFSLCEIDGVPLVNFMARGMGPVEFYLFLSGYGLYYIFKSKKLTGGVI